MHLIHGHGHHREFLVTDSMVYHMDVLYTVFKTVYKDKSITNSMSNDTQFKPPKASD